MQGRSSTWVFKRKGQISILFINLFLLSSQTILRQPRVWPHIQLLEEKEIIWVSYNCVMGHYTFGCFLAIKKKLVKTNKSPNSHYWLTAADKLWGIDQLSSIVHLNAKWDLKQEMSSDIVMSQAGLSPWILFLGIGQTQGQLYLCPGLSSADSWGEGTEWRIKRRLPLKNEGSRSTVALTWLEVAF